VISSLKGQVHKAACLRRAIGCEHNGTATLRTGANIMPALDRLPAAASLHSKVREETETDMKAAALHHFRNRLEEERNQVFRTLHSVTKGLSASAPIGDAVDKAEWLAERESAAEAAIHRTRLLQLIDGALRRVEDGTFGECTLCGREIPRRRLDIIPFARHCVECQERLERPAKELNPHASPGFDRGYPTSQALSGGALL
jgi:DnaK suppressor protein